MAKQIRIHHSELAIPGFIAGVSVPAGRRMGHARALISAESSIDALDVHVVRSPADIGATV